MTKKPFVLEKLMLLNKTTSTLTLKSMWNYFREWITAADYRFIPT